ncbi:hypothetical protein [Saccharothrix algeriensis]|uniref:Uncharacterized protein n=1 Tax=Saccharothrix algeriensis TaxID=173560 RepID=A0A8T8I4C7_9PSEU|nr:hypothetical protein [Saccharothrix algeriensis]MBM7811986.1 hypothetical protein [Saccharothrix algeriensis]QTR05685.1 hypothetical protein J7S33_14690 [Saccharothrix algeriensis]
MELPPAWQRPDPLRGLEKVSWAELSHGAGVGDLLRRTAEGDLDACAQLERRLLDEDTVSEATCHAVPFLAGLGASYKVAGAVRDRVIFLLAATALASAGFTEDGKRTRRHWNPLGRELPRLPPDWITHTRYAVAKNAPKVFDALVGAEVACSMALAIAVPEVAPKHVVDVAQGIAFGGTHPEALVEAACVALHLMLGEAVDAAWVHALAQADPDLRRSYANGGYPTHQPPVVTAQLMGYHYAFLAAYG